MKIEQGQTYEGKKNIICLGYNEEKLNKVLMYLYEIYRKACKNWDREFSPILLKPKEELKKILSNYASRAIEGIFVEDFDKSYLEITNKYKLFSITLEDIKKKRQEKVDIKLWLTKSALFSSVPVYLNTDECNQILKKYLNDFCSLKKYVDYHKMYLYFYEDVKIFDVFSLYYNTQTHWYYFYSELYKGFIPLYYVKGNQDEYKVLRARVYCQNNDKLTDKAYKENIDNIMTIKDANFKYMKHCIERR